MSLTAIITHFYKERLAYLDALVASVRDSTRPADDIIIWNNDEPIEPPRGTRVLQANVNQGSQARFLAALVTNGDVLFLDNDISLRTRTIEQMETWSRSLPHSIISLHGRDVTYSYCHSTQVRSCPTLNVQRVSVSLGRIEYVPSDVLDKLLWSFTVSLDSMMDDLWFSAKAAENGISIWVVPTDGFIEQPILKGVGYCEQPRHYARRETEHKRLFHVA
jgi:hypothetical protein